MYLGHLTDLRFCCAANVPSASGARELQSLPRLQQSLVMPRAEEWSCLAARMCLEPGYRPISKPLMSAIENGDSRPSGVTTKEDLPAEGRVGYLI